MEFSDPPEAADFRERVRAFFARTLPAAG